MVGWDIKGLGMGRRGLVGRDFRDGRTWELVGDQRLM